jgi:hypothetical protein
MCRVIDVHFAAGLTLTAHGHQTRHITPLENSLPQRVSVRLGRDRIDGSIGSGVRAGGRH